MKVFVTLFLTALLSLSLCSQNLVKNSGFEQSGNWWFQSRIFSIAKEKENRFFRIASDKEIKPVFAEQTPSIPVEAGKTYEFVCSFRSAIRSGNVHAMFLIRNRENKCIRFLSTPKITCDTQGQWESLRYTLTIPEKGCAVQIRLYAGMSFAGTVDLDNLSFKEGTGELVIPELDKKPAFTDAMDKDFAGKALILTDFRSFPGSGETAAPDKTELYLGAAEETLCGYFKLYHRKGKTFEKTASPRDNESLLWKNEVLELFLTHINSEAPVYQIAFDPFGQIYDARSGDTQWNSSIKIHSFDVSPECTVLQFELPLSDIGYHYENKGSRLAFRMNAARNHSTLGASQSPVSVWTPVQKLQDPKMFSVFTIRKEKSSGRVSAVLSGSSRIESVKDPALWWKVKNPLFRELISDKPAPFPGLRVFSWNAPIQPSRNRDYALQYGRTYDRAVPWKEYDDHGIRHLEMYHRSPDKDLLPWISGKKGRSIMLLYFTYGKGFDAYKMFEGLADEAREELDKNPGRYSGIAMPDEYLSGVESFLIRSAADPKKKAVMDPIRKEIREKYGYGKYDIPSSVDTDKEPFARLATRKYLLGKMVLAQKKMMEQCREHQRKTGNAVQVIASDPTSQLRIQHQSRIGVYADMVNVQSGPANSATRQRSGFGAKLVTDLSGKPAFCYVHLENLNNVSYNSEASASLISEAFRGGAIGLALYPIDWAGVTRRQGSSNTDRYGHRPRWDTILAISKIINSMNRLKFPEPDYAVFISNDSSLTRRRWEAPPYEAYYNIAGPGAGTWFRFISDVQLADGKEKLSNWKFVVIPKADVVDEALYPLFEQYVENGGTLVCFDPDFAKFKPDGTDGSTFARKLFGVSAQKTAFYDRIVPKIHAGLMKGIAASVPVAAGEIRLVGKSVTVLAASPAGDAVITEKRYAGGGRAVMIAREPSYPDGERPQWAAFNKQLLINLGAKPDQDIWRFTFPHRKEIKPVVKGKCFTGNHFIWWRDKAELTANDKVSPQARYTLTLAPDALKDKSKLEFKFPDGNLTNRAGAFTKGDLFNALKNRFIIREGKIRLDMFADTFSDTKPFRAEFDFGKKIPARKVRIFWSGTLPEVTVTADDGRTAKITGDTTPDVKMSEITLPAGKPVRKLVIAFGARPEGKKLILSEVEVWD